MASLNRIVLLDRGGEELFSGRSMLSSRPPKPDHPPTSEDPATLPYPAASESDEPCPETLRSSIFVRAHQDSGFHATASREIEVTIANDDRAA